jgi:hypothetical protein
VAIVELKGGLVLACFAFFLLGQVTRDCHQQEVEGWQLAKWQPAACPSLQQQLLKNILENKERVI